jgi:hypothetical protein
MYQPIQLKTKNPSLRNSISQSLVAIITLLCAAMASMQSVHAATITVNSTADPTESGKTTLRNALAAASDGDTIGFSVTTPATITLTSGVLMVTKSVIINGPGADQLFVNGNAAASPVFGIFFPVTVTISGLTITNSVGNGIYNSAGTLTINNCTVSGNSGGLGGGIANFGSPYSSPTTLTINNCTVSGNSGGTGGGIYNIAATLTINNSTVSGNSTSSVGGGIKSESGESPGFATLTINNSTISGNSANYGGGIDNESGDTGSSTLTINNCTFSGNSAYPGIGGGIFVGAGDDPGGLSTATIKNSTFSGNSSFGIVNNGRNSTLTIGSTILKAGTSGDNIFNFETGTITSLGYNLSSDADGGDGTTAPGGLLNATGDIRNTDPALGPLQANGGPTFTHALLPGSPAIDKGINLSGSTTDQRGTGFARTVDNGSIVNATGGDGTDIGAFEVQAAAYVAQVQPPINADGTSVFNVKRGVIPVKFTLTLNGVATCVLPAATIAVTRTAGGAPGPIDESVYSGSADTGSNFRIDSCQYIYNLSASALGVGTYRVDIMINSQVVGSATFALK